MLSIISKDLTKSVLILAGIGFLGHSLGIIGELIQQPLFGLPLWLTAAKILVEIGGMVVTATLAVGVHLKSRIMCYPYLLYVGTYLIALVGLLIYMVHTFHCFKIPSKLYLPVLLPTCLTLIILTAIMSGVVAFLKSLRAETQLSLSNAKQDNLAKKATKDDPVPLPIDQAQAENPAPPV